MALGFVELSYLPDVDADLVDPTSCHAVRINGPVYKLVAINAAMLGEYRATGLGFEVCCERLVARGLELLLIASGTVTVITGLWALCPAGTVAIAVSMVAVIAAIIAAAVSAIAAVTAIIATAAAAVSALCPTGMGIVAVSATSAVVTAIIAMAAAAVSALCPTGMGIAAVSATSAVVTAIVSAIAAIAAIIAMAAVAAVAGMVVEAASTVGPLIGRHFKMISRGRRGRIERIFWPLRTADVVVVELVETEIEKQEIGKSTEGCLFFIRLTR
jgi:hypothetical protein